MNDFSAAELVRESNDKFQSRTVEHGDIFNQILERIEEVDFRDRAGLEANDNVSQKNILVISIRELLHIVKTQSFDLTKKDDFIFAFNGEFWAECEREKIKNFLHLVAKRQGVNEIEAEHFEFRDKLFRQFLASADFQDLGGNKNQTLINLKNGTFEVTKDRKCLREFRGADFLTYQLPFSYDPTATCPLFEQFLNRVLPEAELQNILAEFIGYVFTKNRKLEKALLLYGQGANGKSVFFDIMNALFGKDNIANFSLNDLLGEHNRALIQNKLLNYGSEINATKTKDEFKQLVSTEPMTARLKYGNSFTIRDYAKLAFNCNELPKDIDHNNAYFRRLLIVPFRMTIPESEQDKTLASRIIERELSGVFNWVLRGLDRIIKNENFTVSAIVENERETYRREADSVAMFLEDKNCKASQTTSTLLKEFYQDYKTFCIEDGCKPLGGRNFAKRLRGFGFDVERGTANKQYVWVEDRG